MLRRLIDRPVTVTMIILVVVVLGVVGVRRLPVSLIPDISVPYITVQAGSASLSARQINESVISPLRQQMVQVDGLKDIVCEAKDGTAVLKLSFDHGTNMDYAFVEVNEKVDRAMPYLPGIQRPRVLKVSASDVPAFFLNVKRVDNQNGIPTDGHYDESLFPVTPGFTDLSLFVQDVISRRLEQLDEIAMVDVTGLVNEEMIIVPDESKLKQQGLTVADLETIIKQSDITLGALTITDGEYRYDVKFDARVSSAEDVASMWFNWNGRLLQIGDVADVILHPAKRTGLALSDGDDAVCMAIVKQSDAKMADLRKAMTALTEQFEADYPELEFTVTRDQTKLLEYSINNLLQNILLAVILACLAIMAFMRDFKSPVLVAISIPVSLAFAMLCFSLLGMSVNIISLSGLLLGVGMMTDNTIVLIDNITGRWERSKDLRASVLDGTREVVGPMLSSILTTCAVFVPLIFLNGTAGALFRDQALSVAIVLFTSYIVTVTVVPVFYYNWNFKVSQYTVSPVLARLDLGSVLIRWDEKWMGWFLRHKILSWSLLAAGIVLTSYFFISLPKERLPQMTQTDTILKIDWNEQISLEANTARVKEITSLLDTAVIQTTSLVGAQQFILSHSGSQGLSEASVYIDFPDAELLDRSKEMLSDAIKERYPAATYGFEVSGNIFDLAFGSSSARLTARLRPVSQPEVNVEPVRKTIAAIRSAIPGTAVDDPLVKTDAMFVADPESMALLGVSNGEIVSALSNALNENSLFDIVQGTRTIPVVTGSNAESLDEIIRHTVIERRGQNGEDISIPLSYIMRLTMVEDFKTMVSGQEGSIYPIDFDIPSKSVKPTVKAVKDAVKDDGSFEVSFSGSFFESRELARQMSVILLISVILLYLILASQFESLVQPLIILSEIIIDMAVALTTLGIFGVTINVMSMIGLVVMTGIVINDSILKIDTINRLRKEGMGLDEAVMEASSRRVKAIIMTSLTTIIAVAPFLSRGNMGADLQYPLSLVLISGMIIGTLVSLFVVPSLYHSIYHGRKG